MGATDYLVKPINMQRVKAILLALPRTGDLKAPRSARCAASCAASAASA